MKFKVSVGGEPRSVELTRRGVGWECALDGQRRIVDVLQVVPGVFSLLLEGQSFTVSVERTGENFRLQVRGAELPATVENPRRWHGRASGGLGLAGRQEIRAPMPGKVVRVLVEENQAVEAGQGLVVVEAMKMQNQIPSAQKGVVEKILAREGDTVEHGTVLLIVS
ncbi:MAG: biotin/lipoyl-containing protein [Candidatus Acidiferrales bacterium]